MPTEKYLEFLEKELDNFTNENISKREERVINSYYVKEGISPRAVINGKRYLIFNSNDYLGLKFNKSISKAENAASERYGSGPGAVRFISGTLKIHKELERSASEFHNREEAIIFSSAFSTNLSVISTFAKSMELDNEKNDCVVLSDELNHRSIIDGIRLSGIDKLQKKVYPHLNYNELEILLNNNKSTFNRAIVVTDGVFSMLGELANLKKLRFIVDKYDKYYKKGVLLIVDDCHGIGVIGKDGRGCESQFGVKSDLLIGTLGKAFGCDGGYATGDKTLIDYLREKSSPYIFSSPISPSTAGGAKKAISIVSHKKGKILLNRLNKNILTFNDEAKKVGVSMLNKSIHPIQPLLIGDPEKALAISKTLFDKYQIMVTAIGYPAVAKGKDEIRLQLSSLHKTHEIRYLLKSISKLL